MNRTTEPPRDARPRSPRDRVGPAEGRPAGVTPLTPGGSEPDDGLAASRVSHADGGDATEGYGDAAGRPGPAVTVAVGIATAGRRDVLGRTLREIARQTRRPDRILVCPAAPDDVDAALCRELGVEVVEAGRGLPVQRNAILEAAGPADYLVFFDDDFLPAPDYVEQAIRCLETHGAVAAVTGRVVADGVTGPGLSPDEGLRLLAADPLAGQKGLAPVYNMYGCNMTLRLRLVRQHRVRFDEALPLYGWLEDVDFSRLLGRFGTLRRDLSLAGVHLGAKGGRTPGTRLGYSQVANPLYLLRKGTMGARRAVVQIARNLLSNLVGSLRPEAWVDRRGRLRGNLLALRDAARGRIEPHRALDL